MWWADRPYVPVSQRRAGALREMQKLVRKGRLVSPVKVAGRVIAATFWGKAWCENLESYSDFENRLPRGRTYLRNGSVLDLQIGAGEVTSMVSGSSLYHVAIQIRPLAGEHWQTIKTECGRQIASLVELLRGQLSQSVMEIVTRHGEGLFPAPGEIEMSCSCPDWAGMCKHVAATLYGVGNRLDREPELLFKLRGVDHLELIAQAGSPVAQQASAGRRTIAADQLADVFGIELETSSTQPAPASPAKVLRRGEPAAAKKKAARRESAAKPKGRKAATGRSRKSSEGAPAVRGRKRVVEPEPSRRRKKTRT